MRARLHHDEGQKISEHIVANELRLKCEKSVDGLEIKMLSSLNSSF